MNIKDVICEWFGLNKKQFTFNNGKPAQTLQDHLEIQASVAYAAADAIKSFLAIVALQAQEPNTTNKHKISTLIKRYIRLIIYQDFEHIIKLNNIMGSRHRKIILILFLIVYTSFQNQILQQPKIRETVDYEMSFSETSNLTLVYTSCGSTDDLRDGVLSFLYYNTYPLKEIIVVDRCLTPEEVLKNAFPLQHNQNKKWFTIITFQGNQLQVFQKAFERVKTTYIMYYPNKWITTDGFGFAQQAIDAIEYGQRHNIKISQVTSLFLSWKNYRSLSGYTKTTRGTQFYEIRTFKPALKYYFTLNPSLINFDVIFKKILYRDCYSFAMEHGCSQKNLKDCFELELGNVLNRNGYIQAFIDDGAKQPKVKSLLKS